MILFYFTHLVLIHKIMKTILCFRRDWRNIDRFHNNWSRFKIELIVPHRRQLRLEYRMTN